MKLRATGLIHQHPACVVKLIVRESKCLLHLIAGRFLHLIAGR